MKLFLSSYRIPNTKVFSNFIGKDLSNIKLGLILNAKDHKSSEERELKLSEITDYFHGLGIKLEEINLLDYVNKSEELFNRFKKFDVLWFNGGNTYSLIWAVVQSDTEKILKKVLSLGIVYAGDSAGAILAGPTLKYYDLIDDPKLAPKAIYNSLNLIDIAVIPHWGSGVYDQALIEIESNLKIDKYKTIRLSNSEYILVENDKIVKK